MTDQVVEKSCWRAIKEMYEYYFAQPFYEEGKSAAELIRSYREQKWTRRAYFQIDRAVNGSTPEKESELLEHEKNFDEIIKAIAVDIRRRMHADASNGILVAKGRRGLDRPHERIPSGTWSFLLLDVERGVAIGDGLSFIDLHLAWASELPNDPLLNDILAGLEPPPRDALPEVSARNTTTVPMGPEGTRKGGRPSCKDLVHEEFARRCEAGLVKPTLNTEASFYVRWVPTQDQRFKPSLSTIRNLLREAYNARKHSHPAKCPKP
jgi:hypothetical protein